MSQQLISIQKDGNLGLHFNTVKNDLISTGMVENAALSNGRAFNIGSSSSNYTWRKKEPGKELLISMEWTTPGYLPTMGMRLAGWPAIFIRQAWQIVITLSLMKVWLS